MRTEAFEHAGEHVRGDFTSISLKRSDERIVRAIVGRHDFSPL